MPYIGNNIRSADDFRLIDDISSGFNGSATSFALLVAGSSPVPFPKSPQTVLISVNGVIQEPDPTGASGFNLVGTNIVFSSAPTNGHAFFGIIYATADYLNAGGTFPDGSTGSPSITFSNDTDTGLMRIGSGDIGFISNSTQIANIDGNGLTISSGSLVIIDSIIHSGDTNTKIRFSDTDEISLETNGAQRLKVDGSEVVFNNTGANVDFRIEGDSDPNLFLVDASADKIGIGAAPISTGAKFEITRSTSGAFADASDSNLRLLNTDTSGNNNQTSLQFTTFTTGSGADSAIVSQAEDASGNSRIEFWTDTSNGMSEKMVITSTGLVGIGTSSPSGSLDVDAASGVDGPVFSSGGTGNTNHAFIVRDSANTQILRINNNGRVGIGTTSPGNKLHVEGAAGSGAYLTKLFNTIGSGDVAGHVLFLDANRSDTTNTKLIDSKDNKFTVFSNGAANFLSNVGIGSTSRDSIFHVKQDSTTVYDATDDAGQRNSSSILIENGNGGTNTFSQIVFDTADSNQSIARIAAIRTGSATNDLAFVVEDNNTKKETVRFASSGDVKIISQHLRFNTTGKGIIFGIDGGSNRPSIVGNYTSSSDNNIVFNTAGSEAMRLEHNGRLGINTTTPQAFLEIKGTNAGGNVDALHLRNNGSTDNTAVEINMITSTDQTNTASRSFVKSERQSSSSELVFGTGDIERMRLSASSLSFAGTKSGNAYPDATLIFNIKDSNGNSKKAQILSNKINDIHSTLEFGTTLSNTFAERMRIHTNGFVGIGTNSPTALLHVDSDTATAGIRVSGDGNSFLELDADSSIAGTQISFIDFKLAGTVEANIAVNESVSGNPLELNSATDHNISLGTGGGDVGIGTSSPAFKLDVAGAIHSSAAITGQDFRSDASTTFFLTTGNDFRFRNTGGAERMRIDNTPRFYFATTSQGPHGGFYNIDGSNDNVNTLNVKGNDGNYVMISSSARNGGHHIFFSNRQSGSDVNTGTIQDNNSNVSYNTSSDYRIKENIVSISDGITRLKQLNPVRHTFKNNPAVGTVDGWIAHELDTVCPYAVNGEKDAVNEDGTPNLQGVDYGRITPLLTAALKEAIAKIETLETKVAALEAA